MATNLVSLPIYKQGSNNNLNSPNAVYMAFPSTGLLVQPVNPPLNNVNGALVYSMIRSAADSKSDYYSSLTVAAIITLANA
jgi:hypothetical protein